MKKKILKITSSAPQQVGEHRMYQPIPDQGLEQLSPFLLLHHHGPHEYAPYNQGLPFGPHPHRGFETLTFIYEGEIEHKDSQGFSSVITEGGVQWMTAARGIVHSENLSEKQRHDGGKMEIIQLWMNLPASKKMTQPTYQGFQKEEIPSFKHTNFEINVVSGKYKDISGPANSITGLEVYNVKAQKDALISFKFEAGKNILFYVLDGELEVNDKLTIGHQLVVFETENEEISLKINADARFIIASGDPIDEPMVSQGPFVMNSTTEIMQAMRDYQMGKMGVM